MCGRVAALTPLQNLIVPRIYIILVERRIVIA